MYVLLGTALDRDRANQWLRLLGLSKPLLELSSDTLVTAYNPETQSDWTVAGIKGDPEWQAKGNRDQNGETDGFTFEKLRAGDPLGEDNFILTDVPDNDYEQVAKWMRSRLPANDGGGMATTWWLRDGVLADYRKPGSLPDSNLDASGTYPEFNEFWWLRIDIDRSRAWFPQWYQAYISAEPPLQAYVTTQLLQNDKVSNRGGDDTPFYTYENPPGTPLLALVDPAHVEAGGIDWVRLQR